VKRIHIASIHQASHCRKPGYFQAVMERNSGKNLAFVELADNDFDYIRRKYELRGPGHFLHAMLSRFGIKFSKGCKCKARMCQMNKWGCDGCEENIGTIVEWMKEEAAARGLPYLSAVGRMLVRRAISNARKEASRAAEVRVSD